MPSPEELEKIATRMFRNTRLDVSKNSTLNPLMDRTKPLTAAMDNILASALGHLARDVGDDRYCGDSVDRGLVLLRMLDESGFELRLKEAKVSYDEPPEPGYRVPTDAEQLAALKEVRRCSEEVSRHFKRSPGGDAMTYEGPCGLVDDFWAALNDYHDLFYEVK